MKKVHGGQDDAWRIRERVAVSADVAAELDREQWEREKQLQEAPRCEAESEEKSRKRAVQPPTGASPLSDLLTDWVGPKLKLFSWEELEKDRGTFEARVHDADAKQRRSALHYLLMERGEFRRLARLPEDWRQQLDDIEAIFLNFAEIVDYLRAMFAVAELGDRSPRLDPLLLTGTPGVGKSLFAERMGNFFGSGYRRINMENAQTNAQLVGSDEFWANSKAGSVFESLVEGDWGNPTFLLDEVDKVRGRADYDPMGGLFSLLEPATAKTFRDLSLPRIALDASRIYWILTANETDAIPAPILSRVRRFDIPPPTREQAVAILNNIFQAVQCEVKLPVPMDSLSADVVSSLSRVAPRRQKQLVREAIGRALYDNRRRIICADIKLPDDVTAQDRRIGF